MANTTKGFRVARGFGFRFIEFPELVVTNENGTKAVKYQNTVAVLFEAIKEQQKQIEELKQIVNGFTN